jgi:hypothetical protein
MFIGKGIFSDESRSAESGPAEVALAEVALAEVAPAALPGAESGHAESALGVSPGADGGDGGEGGAARFGCARVESFLCGTESAARCVGGLSERPNCVPDSVR